LTVEKCRCATHTLIKAIVGQELAGLARRVSRKLSREEVRYVSRERYAVPDSAVCRAALDLAAECSPAYLLNHCLRSYALGYGMGHLTVRPPDPELFFVGCILHDLGLTERYDTGAPFELDGASAAREFCLAQGLGTDGADLVHEMVALHDAVGVAHRREPEIALLHLGSGLDVAGIQLAEVHPRTLAEIVETYPSLGMRDSFAALLEAQARRKPDSFISGFVGIGFAKKIRGNSAVHPR